MLESAKSYDFATAPHFDAIIVGAGAVGLTMAMDMIQRGLRVAVLEAGPAKPSQESQAFFEKALSTGHNLPGLYIGRFRCLGGTTNFWGGQLVPFAPIVFDRRPWVSEACWPIPYTEVAPYYERAYDILRMSHVLKKDEDVWKALDVAPAPRSAHIEPIFTRWAPETNFSILFRKEILEAPRLTVILDAQVSALHIENEHVAQVDIRCLRGDELVQHTLRANHIVLANGTVEISRLLQLPTADNQAAPWSKNKNIGRYFMDHVDCFAGSVVPIDVAKFTELFENAVINGNKYNPKLRISNETQISEGLLEVSATFVFNSSLSDSINDFKILMKGLLKGRFDQTRSINPFRLLGALRFVIPMMIRYLRYKRVMNFFDRGIQLRLACEQAPLYSSRIAVVADKLDALGIPVAQVSWEIGSETLQTLAKFADYVSSYLSENDIAHVKLDPALQGLDPAFLDQTDDANHQMGGARMAKNADDGVVDSDCAVFGVMGLYVAGAAVFPVTGFANPTFTAIALGLRLSDHICNAHLQSGKHAE